ncbi:MULTISPECIES: zinc ribbon domain-containing protein [unclassified Fusibacter]|uniref:zinc ribbon domain-containing protein n=1 Tax=unclassified Fusibacter TaxID=2624464 RepID=UPI0010131D75|nr:MULTISPECIES: zinc ribbon domain-containing protein [unclassified Fusibacter]MCK8061421.1 zinc ribbon domain-containing protein [Fusibacter sp. A2]NPE23536.1 transcriptional regulator [Fusibacter sp. A1]RXV58947.1 transcriptional regulator [Fusibacter sp. A1]
MNDLICQSCAMPMSNEKMMGTEKDGSVNRDYCTYCYQEGKFTDDMKNLVEMIAVCIPHMVSEGLSEIDAKNILQNTLPNLKRWSV